MIEVNRLPWRLLHAAIVLLCPGRRVTGLTLFTITTGMLITQPVTRIAIRRDVLPALVRMTEVTGHLLMGALQLVLGFFMLEAVFCPLIRLVAILAFFTEATLVW